jgi:hypothetical protein
MNKGKLKYLPFNLFWCVPSFFITFAILIEVLKLGLFESSIVAIYVYLLDVKNQGDIDWLSERVEKLENNKKI